MDAVDSIVDPLREFAKDSVRLVKCCHKPNHKEFTKVAARTTIGFVIMGFVGLSVKLIFIPINNILVGSGLVAMGVPATTAGGTHLRGMDLVDAWKVACADSSGHVVIHVPVGKSYQIWPVTLAGPCRATL